jgi:hypothetical protein
MELVATRNRWGINEISEFKKRFLTQYMMVGLWRLNDRAYWQVAFGIFRSMPLPPTNRIFQCPSNGISKGIIEEASL